DDPDIGAEENRVRDRVDVITRTGNREVVDANAANPLGDEPPGAIGRYIGGMVKPLVGPGAFAAPTSRQENDMIDQTVAAEAFGEERCIERAVRFRVAQVGDEGRPSPAFERDLVEGRAMGQLVIGRIDVAPGMAGQSEEFDPPPGLWMVR